MWTGCVNNNHKYIALHTQTDRQADRQTDSLVFSPLCSLHSVCLCVDVVLCVCAPLLIKGTGISSCSWAVWLCVSRMFISVWLCLSFRSTTSRRSRCNVPLTTRNPQRDPPGSGLSGLTGRSKYKKIDKIINFYNRWEPESFYCEATAFIVKALVQAR